MTPNGTAGAARTPATSFSPVGARPSRGGRFAALPSTATSARLPIGGAATLRAPLRQVPLPVTRTPARRAARRSPGLTWLFDGAGWAWLRAGTDAVALVAATLFASTLQPGYVAELLPIAPIVVTMFALRGMYRRRITPLLNQETISVAGGLAVATMVIVMTETYLLGRQLPEPLLLHFWVVSMIGIAISRAAILAIRHVLRTLRIVSIPTLVLGAGRVGDRIAQRMIQRRGLGLEPVGFLDSDTDASSPFSLSRETTLPVLGRLEDTAEVLERTGAKHLVVSFARERDHDLIPLIRHCTAAGIDVSLVPRLFETINDRMTRESIGPLPLYVMRPTNPRNWEFGCKHVIDRLGAAVGLVLLAPLVATVAIAVRLTSPGPVLFRQRRTGRDGKVFELLKFRSMRVEPASAWSPANSNTAPGGVEGEDRRTKIGRWLRRTSIDELPQLWNVLKGEMSLVGPRPERPEYVERFGYEFERYADRHRVKSGITGWAQVNGLRGQSDLADRIEWDNYYIENWSLGLDLRILARTLVAVFRPAE